MGRPGEGICKVKTTLCFNAIGSRICVHLREQQFLECSLEEVWKEGGVMGRPRDGRLSRKSASFFREGI